MVINAMPFDPVYREDPLTRDDVAKTVGPCLLEFGAAWCGHCQALSPTVERLLTQFPQVQHLRIADGRGKPLGRSFGVKLWPTLVFLRDGEPVAQMSRPDDSEVTAAFAANYSPQ